jgi:predicted nucleic acid-binding protein
MEMILDASAVLSVILGEPAASAVRAAVKDAYFYSASCIEFEMGNALSALVKRNAISAVQAVEAYKEFLKVPVASIVPDIADSLAFAASMGIYAYDAYYLYCAKHMNVPLLTLDKKLAAAAMLCGVKTVPVEGVKYV